MRRPATIALAVSIGLLAAGEVRPATQGSSALDLALAARPSLAGGLSAATRAVLSQVSAEQAAALLRGETSLDALLLPDGTPISHFLESVFGGGQFAIPFYSMDAGGGESRGGAFHLAGTMGQPDAAVLTDGGSGFVLVGGWRGRLESFGLFLDGFETSDTSRWSVAAP